MTRVIPATDAGIAAWLDEALNLEKTLEYREFRLDRVHAVLPRLPRPPAPITITGTKGKGSTTRLMECGLLAAGRRTLAFTSPHLTTVRERWRIDGVPASAEAVAARCAEVAALEAATGIGLTYFERCFAIAVLFAAARPDADFLCEVGLGGRLDCANALDAELVVMTRLSRDHCQLLGDTLEAIAGEKLALCRPGRPLVIAPQSSAGAAAIRTKLPRGSPPHWVTRESAPFALALPGEHQQDNASTALAVLRLARPGLDESRLRAGFAEARLAGRCQLIEHGGRRILVDGAHNGVSVAATIATADTLLRPGWRLVIGVAKDKDIDEIVAAIPSGLEVTRTAYASPRARQASDWPQAAQGWTFAPDVAAALAMPGAADVCVTGSLYLAAEALAHQGVAGRIPG